MTTSDLTPTLARRFGYPVLRGAVVNVVREHSPAARAGIRPAEREEEFNGLNFPVGGDVIVGIDGQAVRSADDVVRLVTGLEPGQVAVFTRRARREADPARRPPRRALAAPRIWVEASIEGLLGVEKDRIRQFKVSIPWEVQERMSDAAAIREVRLTIPAKPEYITLCRLALTGISRLRPLGDETLADLKLALTEACSNSVRHAYGSGDGSVDIRYELHHDRLVIEVADDGAGFDPSESAGDDSGDELVEGGSRDRDHPLDRRRRRDRCGRGRPRFAAALRQGARRLIRRRD